MPLPFSRYQPYRQPDFPFARSELWRIFRIALQDPRFAFHSSRIVTYAQVQKWRHSRSGVFFGVRHQGNDTYLDCYPSGSTFSKGALGCGTQICLSSKLPLSETTCSIRSKLAIEHQVEEFYWVLARHLDPHLLRICGQIVPKSDVFFLLSETNWP